METKNETKPELRKSKIATIGQAGTTKRPGTNYVYVTLENNDKGVIFFKSEKFTKNVGEEIEYNVFPGDNGQTRIKLVYKKDFAANNTTGRQEVNLKLEALKLAVSSFNAGKIEKSGIESMTSYLEDILKK